MRPGSRVFEIGCAYGYFLNLIRDRYQISGIDLSLHSSSQARDVLGLPVHTGEFLDLELARGYYNVYCMWDCIEHLLDPGAYLEKIAGHSNPGTLLALSTGDVGSAMAKFRGRRWRMIDPPAHLCYFSRQSVTRILTHYGYKVLHISSIGVYRSFKQTALGLRMRLPPERKTLGLILAQMAKMTGAFYLNLGDIMLVIASLRE